MVVAAVEKARVARKRVAQATAVALSAYVVIRTRELVMVAGAIVGDVRTVDVVARISRQRRRLVLVTLAVHRVPRQIRQTSRASISQYYWGDIKQDWGSGHPSMVLGESTGRGSGGRSPPEAETFL